MEAISNRIPPGTACGFASVCSIVQDVRCQLPLFFSTTSHFVPCASENCAWYPPFRENEPCASVLELPVTSPVSLSRIRKERYFPGRTASLIVNGKKVGKFGVIFPETADNFDAPEKAVFFEIECDALTNAAKTERVYKQLPKYPGIARDIAVMVDKSVPVGEIIKTCKSAGGKLLKEVEFFDVYEDAKLGNDMKSVAVSLMFRDDNKTLTDADIKESYDKILDKLAKNYDAKLR